MSLQLRGGNELIDPVKLLEHGGIKQGDVVADLGCGSAGHFVFPAAHLVGAKGKVYAVDILKSVLGAIQSRERLEGLDNVQEVWADLEKPGATKIAAGSVDLVLLLNTLFQTKDKAAVLAEASRIAKAGGTLVVAEWKSSGAPFGPAVELHIDKNSIRSLAQSAGFELKEEFEAGPYHYGLVLKKRA